MTPLAGDTLDVGCLKHGLFLTASYRTPSVLGTQQLITKGTLALSSADDSEGHFDITIHPLSIFGTPSFHPIFKKPDHLVIGPISGAPDPLLEGRVGDGF